MLTAADDRLHPPVTDDSWWTETAWFGFAVPARGICGSLYQIYRPNQGVMATAVYVWQPGQEDLRELPYYRAFWHLPIPDGAHPCENELPSGLSVRTVEPMTSYRIRYEDDAEISLELDWVGIVPAQPLHVSNGMGHLDQLGRVTGRLRLHGEEHEVDCVEMRDRSWTPRRETTARTRRGYLYGARSDASRGFFAATNVGPGGGTDEVIGGWVLDGGDVRTVRGGERRVHRDESHRPVTVELWLALDDGEERWTGQVRSRLALPTTPYFAWMSLTEWTADDGTTCFGEDHDSWSPARWRAFCRGAER
ncbi:MAG: hypothetical protein ACO1PW_11935 [Actinomycetota bacterium]